MEQRKILLSFLYGSQNYGLNNPNSDKDYTHVYMPNETDIFYGDIRGKIKNTEHDKYIPLPNFIKQVLKGNINYWEYIFSTAINIYTYDARNLLYFLQDNAQKILQYSANGFVNSAKGAALQFLNEFDKKRLARSYYYALLTNKLISNDMLMTCETWRNSEVCHIPHMIRYSSYKEVKADDVKSLFNHFEEKELNYDNNYKKNVEAVGKAEEMAKNLFFKEIL